MAPWLKFKYVLFLSVELAESHHNENQSFDLFVGNRKMIC